MSKPVKFIEEIKAWAVIHPTGYLSRTTGERPKPSVWLTRAEAKNHCGSFTGETVRRVIVKIYEQT